MLQQFISYFVGVPRVAHKGFNIGGSLLYYTQTLLYVKARPFGFIVVSRRWFADCAEASCNPVAPLNAHPLPLHHRPSFPFCFLYSFCHASPLIHVFVVPSKTFFSLILYFSVVPRMFYVPEREIHHSSASYRSPGTWVDAESPWVLRPLEKQRKGAREGKREETDKMWDVKSVMEEKRMGWRAHDGQGHRYKEIKHSLSFSFSLSL